MTGLSKNSHKSGTLKLLKLFTIHELYSYMKLIFVKNLKNNYLFIYFKASQPLQAQFIQKKNKNKNKKN
jgi:hypothetical protein